MSCNISIIILITCGSQTIVVKILVFQFLLFDHLLLVITGLKTDAPLQRDGPSSKRTSRHRTAAELLTAGVLDVYFNTLPSSILIRFLDKSRYSFYSLAVRYLSSSFQL